MTLMDVSTTFTVGLSDYSGFSATLVFRLWSLLDCGLWLGSPTKPNTHPGHLISQYLPWIYLWEHWYTAVVCSSLRYSSRQMLKNYNSTSRDITVQERYGSNLDVGWLYGAVCLLGPFGKVNNLKNDPSSFCIFDFCVCLVHPSVVYECVLYFMYEKQQAYSVTRQGRFEMVRGNVPRNVHCLATILRMLKIICNPAMYTRSARICNAAKLLRNSTRQRTYVLYLCTEQNQSTSVMRQGVFFVYIYI